TSTFRASTLGNISASSAIAGTCGTRTQACTIFWFRLSHCLACRMHEIHLGTGAASDGMGRTERDATVQRIRSRHVRLSVADPLEIEPGAILQPGTYLGTEKQIGIETLDGVSWARPTYRLELSA